MKKFSKISSYKKNNVIAVVIAVWFIVSILRLAYNYSKLFTEDRKFFFLSLEQKRNELFPCYKIVQYLSYLKKDQKVLYIGENGYCFYTIKYFLYPAEVFINPKKNFRFDAIVSESVQKQNKKLKYKINVNGGNFYIYE